jgi:P-type Ca2+ transporter type 2C
MASHPTHDDAQRGLSAADAARRLAVDGPNELPSHKPRTLLAIAREVLTEPMFLLLIAAASIYVVLGELREALILASSIVIIIVVTIVQQRRTERVLAALRDLSSPRAIVIRDGIEQRVAGREVVVDDVVLLREGDRVPADGIVLSASALSADESILTGESLPVDKAPATSGANEQALVYSGSLVVRGFGTMQARATGVRTEIGRIGRAVTSLPAETTPLFREVRRIVRWVALGALTLCAAIALIYATSRGDWLGGVLAGITLAMGVLPEEFPVVLTVFLAMGAWRISRTGVLTRRMPAIESIGAATLLAVDKTGTLTENRMQVVLLEPSAGDSCDLRKADAVVANAAETVLATALAASERNPFDPMERAIHEAAKLQAPASAARLQTMDLIREYDLTPELLAVTHVWQSDSQQLEIAIKGAPETVFDLCRLDAHSRTHLSKRVAAHAADGLRVLAVARTTGAASRPLPESPRAFDPELLGLLCLADPLRHDVPAALAECARAGVRVVMITGDHAGTALAIAAQAGFDISGGVLTGAQLDSLSDAELQQQIAAVNIFARTKPEQKLRLVQMFKAAGEVVAMTGDGVNDAPALRAAHIGVAMGRRGTDVAREAAALVLVNDDFASLVAAVRLGRRIYGNIRHAMTYIVAVHIPIAGLGLLPVLFGWPLLFMPVHVLFLEFIIDPACAFVFEADAAAPDIMRRRPRRPDEPLFSRAMLGRGLWLGCAVLALCAAVYGTTLQLRSADEARALAFLTLVAANLTLIFVSRSRSESLARILAKPNRVYWWIVALASSILALAIGLPALAEVFRFAAPPLPAIAAGAVIAVISVLSCGWLLRNR